MTMHPGLHRRMRATLATLAISLVAGCGFQLRSTQTLPFDSMYIAVPENSEFGTNLKRSIRATGSTRIAETADGASAVLTPTVESQEKDILSFNSAGRVREFQLRYRYAYRVHDAKGRDLIDPVSITMTRDFSFDDASVLAKAQEESLLWRDMQSDLVQQILRRLAASRPRAASVE